MHNECLYIPFWVILELDGTYWVVTELANTRILLDIPFCSVMELVGICRGSAYRTCPSSCLSAAVAETENMTMCSRASSTNYK